VGRLLPTHRPGSNKCASTVQVPSANKQECLPALDDAQSSALLFAITINELDRSIQDKLLPEIRDRFQTGPDTSHAKGIQMDGRFLLIVSSRGVLCPHRGGPFPGVVLIF
jgi:hypothetical protein